MLYGTYILLFYLNTCTYIRNTKTLMKSPGNCTITKHNFLKVPKEEETMENISATQRLSSNNWLNMYIW